MPSSIVLNYQQRQKNLKIRTQVEYGIRSFFLEKGFQEVRTPLLVSSPGVEVHIQPFQVHSDSPLFLPTSPEFGMKKLLCMGEKKIFQLASSFRDEPNSTTHRPEFTCLEWYDTDGLEAIYRQTEALCLFLSNKIKNSTEVSYQGQVIDLSSPWPRHSVQELFQKHLNFKLKSNTPIEKLVELCHAFRISTNSDDDWDDLYFKLWLNEIEPNLDPKRPCFVHSYPTSQSALAKQFKDAEGCLWANRFEVYVAGLEIANAYDELTHVNEQRDRFTKDQVRRKKKYSQDNITIPPLDESLLSLMENPGLPSCGGIALGVDRLSMLFANAKSIEDVLWL